MSLQKFKMKSLKDKQVEAELDFIKAQKKEDADKAAKPKAKKEKK